MHQKKLIRGLFVVAILFVSGLLIIANWTYFLKRENSENTIVDEIIKEEVYSESGSVGKNDTNIAIPEAKNTEEKPEVLTQPQDETEGIYYQSHSSVQATVNVSLNINSTAAEGNRVLTDQPEQQVQPSFKPDSRQKPADEERPTDDMVVHDDIENVPVINDDLPDEKQEATCIVSYIDVHTNRDLTDIPYSFTAFLGDEIKIDAMEFPGYRLVEGQSNTYTFVLNEDLSKIIFLYEKDVVSNGYAELKKEIESLNDLLQSAEDASLFDEVTRIIIAKRALLRVADIEEGFSRLSDTSPVEDIKKYVDKVAEYKEFLQEFAKVPNEEAPKGVIFKAGTDIEEIKEQLYGLTNVQRIPWIKIETNQNPKGKQARTDVLLETMKPIDEYWRDFSGELSATVIAGQNNWQTSDVPLDAYLNFRYLVPGQYDAYRHMYAYIKDFVRINIEEKGITSEIAKARIIHEHIIKEYDYARAELKTQGKVNSHGISIHSILSLGTDNIGVCQSYARYFYEMCRQAGLNAGYVNGYYVAYDGHRSHHAWNTLEIDGETYWVDITWDDPYDQKDTKRGIDDWFLIGSKNWKEHEAYKRFDSLKISEENYHG